MDRWVGVDGSVDRWVGVDGSVDRWVGGVDESVDR